MILTVLSSTGQSFVECPSFENLYILMARLGLWVWGKYYKGEVPFLYKGFTTSVWLITGDIYFGHLVNWYLLGFSTMKVLFFSLCSVGVLHSTYYSCWLLVCCVPHPLECRLSESGYICPGYHCPEYTFVECVNTYGTSIILEVRITVFIFQMRKLRPGEMKCFVQGTPWDLSPKWPDQGSSHFSTAACCLP